MWLHSNETWYKPCGIHKRTKYRFGGYWRGGAYRESAEVAEQHCLKDFFCQRTKSATDLSSVSASTRWEIGADSFHGDKQPAIDAAFAHHLSTNVLSQQLCFLYNNTLRKGMSTFNYCKFALWSQNVCEGGTVAAGLFYLGVCMWTDRRHNKSFPNKPPPPHCFFFFLHKMLYL